MPWRKERSGTYFYITRRANGKRECKCLGKGPLAQAEADRIAVWKQDVAKASAMNALDRKSDQMMAELKAMISDQVTSVMTDLGFHENQGKWQKRQKQRID